MLILAAAAYVTSAEHRPWDWHNYILSDDFIDEINREATTWTAGRNFHPHTSTNYIKVAVVLLNKVQFCQFLIFPISESRPCWAFTQCTRNTCRH